MKSFIKVFSIALVGFSLQARYEKPKTTSTFPIGPVEKGNTSDSPLFLKKHNISLGIHAGVTAGRVNKSVKNLNVTGFNTLNYSGDAGLHSVVGSMSAGYDYSTSSFISGVEYIFSAHTAKSRKDFTSDNPLTSGFYRVRFKFENAILARVGFYLNQTTALNVKFGGSLISVEQVATMNIGTPANNKNTYKTTTFGFTLGGGLETKYRERQSLVIDFRATPYRKVNYTLPSGTTPMERFHSARATFFMTTIGMKFIF